MNIFINNIPTKLPNDFVTIKDLVSWKQIPKQGTAIAVNDKLIKQDQWSSIYIKELDQITVISAAFGG